MRRVLLLAVAIAAVWAIAPGAQSAARAGTECNGLPVCIPVAGPWVKVPPQTGSRRLQTLYRQSCPSGAVIGGLDAEVTHRSIELSFGGRLGGPVGPGVTTSSAAIFAATETGRLPLPTAFKPLLGCIPGGGGGRGRTMRPPSRSLTAVGAKPGEPTVYRSRSFRVRPGRTTKAWRGCLADERLISSSHAVAFQVRDAPTARQLAQVTSRGGFRTGRIRVTTEAATFVSSVRVQLQILALCARPNP